MPMQPTESQWSGPSQLDTCLACGGMGCSLCAGQAPRATAPCLACGDQGCSLCHQGREPRSAPQPRPSEGSSRGSEAKPELGPLDLESGEVRQERLSVKCTQLRHSSDRIAADEDGGPHEAEDMCALVSLLEAAQFDDPLGLPEPPLVTNCDQDRVASRKQSSAMVVPVTNTGAATAGAQASRPAPRARREDAPQKIQITGVTGSSAMFVNGSYALQPEQHDNRPAWQKADNPDTWLVHIDNKWLVTTALHKSSGEGTAWLSSTSHSYSPLSVCGWNVLGDDGACAFQATVRVRESPAEALKLREQHF